MATITATLTSVSTLTTSAVTSATSAASSQRAPSQSGILEGLNPVEYDPKNPIVLFIIQAGIIIVFCRLLHYPLSYLRQPRVIAEVIGGVILGPSVMMRIPGFQQDIFPTASMPILNLVANLGLVLFLFLVGLEVDVRLFSSNWKIALSVGFAGMVLPFGLGSAIAWGLYHQFRTDAGIVPISFGVYMLFIGTALSITAFPVLCRILTELKLLHTTVGITVLAAGVGNDVVGWILLALCVALVNNGSGLAALWVLLCCIGWILFLFFIIKPVFHYFLRRSGSIQNGPTQGMVALTILLVLTSAWFTSVIGVHAIFGAFIVGLICPHDGGFAIKLTEKIEDLVSVLFLPLYFALSGLSTNLGLLNDGITWGYTIAIIVVAFAGKIIGGTLAAYANKMVWRESLTIGVLMSCKGLVEIIVLNIGLQAHVLSTRTFTMFVVMALVTTVATTPLTSFLYPPRYQKKLEAWKRGEIDWEGNRLHQESDTEESDKTLASGAHKILVYLRLDNLSSIISFISLLGEDASPVTLIHPSKGGLADTKEESVTIYAPTRQPLQVHGLRILELTDRTSSVMKVSEEDEYSYRDPVINAFRTFSQQNNVAASGEVSIVPESSFATTLTSKASDVSADLVLIPWSGTGALSEGDSTLLFRENPADRYTSTPHNAFIEQALDSAVCNTAIFVDRGFGGTHQRGPVLRRVVAGHSISEHSEKPRDPISDLSHHIYLPFFGGPDDKIALRFVLQMANKSNITASIVHFQRDPSAAPITPPELKRPTEFYTKEGMIRQRTVSRNGSSGTMGTMRPFTPIPNPDPEALIVALAQDTAFLQTIRDSLPPALGNRVVFSERITSTPLTTSIEVAREEVAQSPRNAGDLIVLGRGRGKHLSQLSGDLTASGNWAEARDVVRSLGSVAQAVINGDVRASILVVQAGGQNTT